MAAAHTSAAVEQSAGSSSGGRRLGSSSMRPRVVHGDGFTSATTATWHGWWRPVRPRIDHGGGTWLVNDGVVEQRGVPGRLRTTALVRQLTGVSWPRGVSSAVDTPTSVPVKQLSRSSRFNRRPFSITTDVKTDWKCAHLYSVSVNFASRACQPVNLQQYNVFCTCADSLSAEQPDRCDAVGDQQRGKHAHAGSYASIHAGGHASTHKRTKRQMGVSGHGLGNQPQQCAPLT